MELKCSNCDATIPAENINIQETLAVCPECSHVFDFRQTVTRRKKQQSRKVRQPSRLHVRDEDNHLEMSYSRVFGEDERVGIIISPAITIFVATIMAAAYQDGAPLFVLVIFALAMLFFGYITLSGLLNSIRLTLDEDQLKVTTSPLPQASPFSSVQGRSIDRADIARIYVEQTEKSQKSTASLLFYNVVAELVDGSKTILFKGMPQQYAFYIAQELNNRESDTALDALLDDDESDLLVEIPATLIDGEMEENLDDDDALTGRQAYQQS